MPWPKSPAPSPTAVDSSPRQLVVLKPILGVPTGTTSVSLQTVIHSDLYPATDGLILITFCNHQGQSIGSYLLSLKDTPSLDMVEALGLLTKLLEE